jgi:hypothetical protein
MFQRRKAKRFGGIAWNSESWLTYVNMIKKNQAEEIKLKEYD